MNPKLALLTGATSGIGEQLAFLLAKHQVRLILSGRQENKLKEMAEHVGGEYLVADLAQTEGRQKLIHCLLSQEVDLVINCAGFGYYGDVLSLSVKEQLSIVEVNALAAFELTLEAVRNWIQRGKKGIVLNVSSVAGEFPTPGMSAYGASKAFLTQVSQALHTEAAPYGISVLVNSPGMVATSFANRAAKRILNLKETWVLTPESVAQSIWKQIEHRKETSIVDWKYRLGIFFSKQFIPTTFIKKIVWNQIKKRM